MNQLRLIFVLALRSAQTKPDVPSRSSERIPLSPSTLSRKLDYFDAASRAARDGGEGGIRTPGTLRYTAFPVLHNRPLCHLSVWPVNISLN
jgi:hypothetical protein